MRIATRPGSALVPRLLKLGLCLCIKPAKSVLRMCESASLPRVVNQARSRCASVALVLDKLHCIFLCHHASDAGKALRLRRFESPKRALLGTSSPPRSDAARHLGGSKSALTGAYSLSLPRCCGRHHRPLRIALCFRQPTGSPSPFLAARARIFPPSARHLATHCNLSTSSTTGTAFAFTPTDPLPCKADRTRSPSRHLLDVVSLLCSLSSSTDDSSLSDRAIRRAAASCRRRFSLIRSAWLPPSSHPSPPGNIMPP
jgi:hypothetical protein